MFVRTLDHSVDALIDLKIEDFKITRKLVNILLTGQRLTDEIIHAYFASISKKTKNHVFVSKVVGDILSGNCVTAYTKNFSFLKYDTLAGVFNKNDNHWCLLLLSVINQTVSYVDPYENKQNDYNLYYENWRYCPCYSFFSLFKITIIYSQFWATRKESKSFNFKRFDFNHVLQKKDDVTNCGVYVCKYYDDFLKKKTSSNFENQQDDLMLIRKDLHKTLLENGILYIRFY